MLFPTLSGKKFREIDLDREAIGWIEEYEKKNGATSHSPLLDPHLGQRFIEGLHRRYGVDWSYGGYLENRRHLWRGGYMETSGDFIHLGVDFNVPQGTPLITEYDASVVVVDDDGDQDGGWGQRIFLKPVLPLDECPFPALLLIYAHLQNVVPRSGQQIRAGTVLAEVGGPPNNGNWPPHLHIQALRYEIFSRILVEGFANLDGYGHPDRLAEYPDLFPNPLDLLHLE
jgi:murein DD-endopeptidase MepM/ murein hydrolase activator NlpD